MQLVSNYEPLPPQRAFRDSKAKVRGYGGAMGGGKSRAICEEAFDLALEHPGLRTLICRQSHTSIIETTKKTMISEVIPPELLARCQSKESQGEDFLRLWNGSEFHFIGLDKPERWFSSEIGLLVIDQAEECSEETVVLMSTRLRQREMPNRIVLSFNPDNPGHWLQRWFILGAGRTEFGFYKDKLWTTGANRPIGDAEFVFAKAADNPYLPDGYVEETLGGLPEYLRRRMLEGEWLFVSGACFFDTDALGEYQRRVSRPRWTGYTAGDPLGKDRVDRCRILPDKKGGPLSVWVQPIRQTEDEETGKVSHAHRYVISVDVSSGGATDFSAIQVIDVEEFAQVAEYQAKLDPDLVAVEVARLGRIYNDALVAPETTGGWGHTIVQYLQRLKYPRIYTRRIEDRLTKQWTDKLGWDTTAKSRAYMLDTLEKSLREREFELRGERSLAELATFVRDDNGKPQAQPGCNDDLVMALAIGVTLATQLPKQLHRPKEKPHQAQFAATGY